MDYLNARRFDLSGSKNYSMSMAVLKKHYGTVQLFEMKYNRIVHSALTGFAVS